jgi:hypothetical protein
MMLMKSELVQLNWKKIYRSRPPSSSGALILDRQASTSTRHDFSPSVTFTYPWSPQPTAGRHRSVKNYPDEGRNGRTKGFSQSVGFKDFHYCGSFKLCSIIFHLNVMCFPTVFELQVLKGF